MKLTLIINYIFSYTLQLLWYIASVLIIYLSIRLSKKYHFLQFNIKEILSSLKSKSKNNISPISSLCISLASKIGVGSLSGIALAIYYGGIGTIFWIIVIGLFTSINTYCETKLGIKYREKIKNKYIGGPSYYIKKCLHNKKLSTIYSIIVIITYSYFFLSIQSNTIVTITKELNINTNLVLFIMITIIIISINKGIEGISKIGTIIVPLMLTIYILVGVFVVCKNITIIPKMFFCVIKSAFQIKSIISTFLIGMQRAIFITESGIGTSAITSSICENDSGKQGLIEIFGNYVIILLICLNTFIIIVTSNYNAIEITNINGIELITYAFNYHFGINGKLILSLITILFAFSTMISSYLFGESNLLTLSKKDIILTIYKILFIVIIILSSYIKPVYIWNTVDMCVAWLAIMNIKSITKILKKSDFFIEK